MRISRLNKFANIFLRKNVIQARPLDVHKQLPPTLRLCGPGRFSITFLPLLSLPLNKKVMAEIIFIAIIIATFCSRGSSAQTCGFSLHRRSSSTRCGSPSLAGQTFLILFNFPVTQIVYVIVVLIRPQKMAAYLWWLLFPILSIAWCKHFFSSHFWIIFRFFGIIFSFLGSYLVFFGSYLVFYHIFGSYLQFKTVCTVQHFPPSSPDSQLVSISISRN